MENLQLISALYEKYSGHHVSDIVNLPKSGSDRMYFRITDSGSTVIGTYNKNREENDAFVGFSKHFSTKGLKVPEIYACFPEQYVYFQQDLGEVNLFNWLQQKEHPFEFDAETEELYKQILDNLILFQTKGIEDLNIDLCYPHKSFDRQSMMWDMNYFKYMFLKLIAVPFNEKRLEHDFNTLADHLLEADQNYFLYRDFQSANIMLYKGETWFIDYQGGRQGALQYDVASLLYDAKAYLPLEECDKMVEYYIGRYCSETGETDDKFRKYFTGFSLIRLMQALGAFGFRGLYEQKPTFTGSIVPAIKILLHIIDSGSISVNLPELINAVKTVPELEIYKTLSKEAKL